jgi:serine/threonine-protein phosphatase 2A activator
MQSTTPATVPVAEGDGSTASSLPPRRYIFNQEDLNQFKDSSAKRELLSWTRTVGHACRRGRRYDATRPLGGLTPALAAFHGALCGMYDAWYRDFPSESNTAAAVNLSVRFGHPAFRSWHARLVERAPAIIRTVLAAHSNHKQRQEQENEFDLLQQASHDGYQAAVVAPSSEEQPHHEESTVVVELATYLQLSFGHPVRLDYGTGHETQFQVLLLCLSKVGAFPTANDDGDDVDHNTTGVAAISLYHAYLRVTRQLQSYYRLEPAGSHGVWGLDDYYCLSFYLGACQMEQEEDVDYGPSCIHHAALVEREKDRLLYLSCVHYIRE